MSETKAVLCQKCEKVLTFTISSDDGVAHLLVIEAVCRNCAAIWLKAAMDELNRKNT